jgi:hypothetical protein
MHGNVTYPCPSTTSSSASCLQLLQVPFHFVSVQSSSSVRRTLLNTTYHFVGCVVVLRGVPVAEDLSKWKWACGDGAAD